MSGAALTLLPQRPNKHLKNKQANTGSLISANLKVLVIVIAKRCEICPLHLTLINPRVASREATATLFTVKSDLTGYRTHNLPVSGQEFYH